MSKRRVFILVIAVIFVGFVLADSMLVWHDEPYIEIPHGNHVHYMPKGCDDEDVDMDSFPTAPPGPGEVITCEGETIAADATE